MKFYFKETVLITGHMEAMHSKRSRLSRRTVMVMDLIRMKHMTRLNWGVFSLTEEVDRVVWFITPINHMVMSSRLPEIRKI